MKLHRAFKGIGLQHVLAQTFKLLNQPCFLQLVQLPGVGCLNLSCMPTPPSAFLRGPATK